MSVRWVRVGDVLELRRQPVEIDPTRDYEYVGVRSFARGLVTYPPTPGDQLSKMRYFSLPRDALVISNIKAWEGGVATTSSDTEGIVVSNRFLPYRPRTNDADIRYVWHYFASEEGTAALARVSPGSADRNRTLGIAPFENLRIPLPGLNEQRRIAARLDAVATAAGRVTSPPNVQLVERAVWRQGGDAPTRRMGDLVQEASRPMKVEETATYQLLGVRWYGEGLFVRETRRGSELAAKTVYRVDVDDLVYNRLFAWKGSFAQARREHAGAVVSNEFPCFRVAADDMSVEYLAYWLRRPDVWETVESKSTGSTPTSRNRFKIDRFLELRVPVPSGPDQERLVRTLEEVATVRSLSSTRHRLGAALLPAARNEEFSRLTSA